MALCKSASLLHTKHADETPDRPAGLNPNATADKGRQRKGAIRAYGCCWFGLGLMGLRGDGDVRTAALRFANSAISEPTPGILRVDLGPHAPARREGEDPGLGAP